MSAIKPGRVCIKTAGREAGRKVVVLSVKDNTAMVEGVNVKRRKCNIAHLEPLPMMVKANEKSSSDEIAEMLKQ